MKRLKTVKIGGRTYRIKYKDGLARLHDAAGRSCASKCTIDIDPVGATHHKREIFWHEVIEQLNYIYELNLPHSTITVLGAGLYQVLADNPGILEGIR